MQPSEESIEEEVAVIGITDYFHIEGYKKLINEYLNDDGKMGQLFSPEEISKIKEIKILPNIEFRLNPIADTSINPKTGNRESANVGRVNFHVIFSDKVSPQVL